MILYAGSYTQEVDSGLSGVGDGIYCFSFNDVTGELKLLNSLPSRNTGFLAISANKKYLYSFQEVHLEKDPVVLAFSIEANNTLQLINEQPIQGGLPCHLVLMPNDEFLAIACYGTGSVHLFPISENGGLEACLQNIHHKGSSVNLERQEAAHAHMVYPFKNELFVPDLGIDTIVNYKFNSESTKLDENYKIRISEGAGPRHLIIHPSERFAFVINELTGIISILKYFDGTFKEINTINSLPRDYQGVPSGAAIQIENNGKFLYCSNRGSETITIFEFNEIEESLTIIGFQEVYGKTLRDFTISPNGKWLLCANQDSNEIVVFKIDPKNGLLERVGSNDEAQSMVCLKWL